jgi:hypothetical protein
MSVDLPLHVSKITKARLIHQPKFPRARVFSRLGALLSRKLTALT